MMVDVYFPYVSGVTHSVALCRRALEAAGHEVFVLTFGMPASSDDERVLRSPGLPLRMRYGATRLRVGFRHGRRVRRLLRSLDVLHVHHPFISGRLALRYRRRDQPIVYTSHTRYDLHVAAHVPAWIGDRIQGVVATRVRRFCQRCDLVLAPTEQMRSRLAAWGVSSPIQVLSLGIDRRRFGAVASRRDGTDPVRAIYVGRLGPEKNLRLLLDAFRVVAHRRPGFELMVAGDGPARASLVRYARAASVDGRVRFPGFVPYAEVPELLARADFFVTPSLSEVQPLSVMEAMGAGLPVLGLVSPGTAALVEDGSSGVLAPDRRSFTVAMERLVDHAAWRRQLGIAAAAASSGYSVEVTASRLVTCYQRLVTQAWEESDCR